MYVVLGSTEVTSQPKNMTPNTCTSHRYTQAFAQITWIKQYRGIICAYVQATLLYDVNVDFPAAGVPMRKILIR